jgi:hypothetical protein
MLSYVFLFDNLVTYFWFNVPRHLVQLTPTVGYIEPMDSLNILVFYDQMGTQQGYFELDIISTQSNVNYACFTFVLTLKIIIARTKM